MIDNFKQCTKCLEIKTFDSFYRRRPTVSGDPRYSSHCRQCMKTAAFDYRMENIDKVREYDRNRMHCELRKAKIKEYQRTAEGMESQRKSAARMKKKYPDKNKAQNQLYTAVLRGKMERLPCEVCASTDDIHGHHDDYSKPLEVRWLCRKHHVEIHVEINRKART